MTVVLRSEVEVHQRLFSVGGAPAIMDLHDNGRFVLVEIEPRTNQFGQILIDTPVSELRVGGASTYLTIRFNGRKTRVDFAGQSPVGFAALGIVGAVVANQYATDAGLKNWVAAFKQRGVLKGYSNTVRNVVILSSVTVLLFVGIIMAIGLANAYNP